MKSIIDEKIESFRKHLATIEADSAVSKLLLSWLEKTLTEVYEKGYDKGYNDGRHDD